MQKKANKSLTAAELSSFCGQVALILEAGLPLYDGMETLAEGDEAGVEAEFYRAVSRGVNETGSLGEALRSDERCPGYLAEMVAIGERAGQLEKVMRGLEKYYAREERIRSSITGAVTYPLVLGGMLVAIVLILLWRVLPVFRRVLESMGVSANESGRRMMQLGSVVGWTVLLTVAAAIAAGLVTAALLRTSRREQVLERLRGAFPAAARLNTRLNASRAAGVLSMTLSGGFRTDEAVEMAAHVLTDRTMRQKMEQVRTGIAEGRPFTDLVAEARLFDRLHDRMIRMGGATGHEDQVLSRLADLYEEQAEEDIARLISIVEPTLIALLSIVIGAVLLSVMLPMAGILTSL